MSISDTMMPYIENARENALDEIENGVYEVANGDADQFATIRNMAIDRLIIQLKKAQS